MSSNTANFFVFLTVVVLTLGMMVAVVFIPAYVEPVPKGLQVPVALTAAPTSAPATIEPIPVATTSAPPETAGVSGDILMQGSDCLACHKPDIKLVGPSFAQIAAKYKNQPGALEQLVQKVKAGGAGSWGPIPMAPHPTLSEDQIRVMVSWILDQTPAASPAANGDTILKSVAMPLMGPIAYAEASRVPAHESAAERTQPLAPLPEAGPIDAKMAELGRHLFFDTRLSGDTTLSCASCHDPLKGYGDGQALGDGYPGALYFRNVPTLLNTTLGARFMWDGRLNGGDVDTLVRDMITEAHTMNMDSRLMQERLKQVPQYVSMWREIFGTGSDPYGPRVYKVVGEFVKTIRSQDVTLDRYLRGDKSALSDSAQRGLALFKGRAGCIRCHDGPLLSDGGLHATGVPEHPEVWRDPLRSITILRYYASSGVPNYMNRRVDVGHYAVSKSDADLGKFRTPTLRELRHTGPYMHNGVFATLEQVINFYDAGGGEAASKSPLLRPLGLSEQDKRDLVAMLEALSSDPVVIEKPALPDYQTRVFGQN